LTDAYPSNVTTPQTGIFALGTMSHAHLELDTRQGADAGELVRLVAGLREPRTTIGGVNIVPAFAPSSGRRSRRTPRRRN
jgi:porphyrinogen peroxidase